MKEAHNNRVRAGRSGAGFGRGGRLLRRFTLLEMLVAAGLLVVVSVLVFTLYSRLQAAYAQSLSATDAAENARLALDVICQDLQTAVSQKDDIPGRDIEFDQPDTSTLWFVSGGDGGDSSTSGLIEVGYRMQDNAVQRAYVDDSCSAWHVYGSRDAADQEGGYRTVIDGVLELRFICYGERLIPYQPQNADQLPYMVTVSITLLDSRDYRIWQHASAARRQTLERQASRTFRETVYLGGGGGNSA